LVGLATQALAQEQNIARENFDRETCGSGTPDRAILSCTRIIDDKSEPAGVRVVALRNRGFHYQSQGELDPALADYNAVLKSNARDSALNARTYVNRGLVYARKGDVTQALADYGLAISLDPALASAYANRASSRAATRPTPSPISTQR
jgi:tetratricopeptide (TPR) repeat protein